MSGDVYATPDIFEIPVVVDGEQHSVTPADWPHRYARDWERMFRGTEMPSLATALRAAFVFGRLHIHHVAGLWWLHRRAQGEDDLDFDEVDFTYADYEASSFAQQELIRTRLREVKAKRADRERDRGKATRRPSNDEKPTP